MVQPAGHNLTLPPPPSLPPVCVPVVLIHWTRQFKDVLGAQHMVEMGDSAGPLEEITFWSQRCADLTGISLQLQKPSVRHIQGILALSRSSYLKPFSKLAQEIQVGPPRPRWDERDGSIRGGTRRLIT